MTWTVPKIAAVPLSIRMASGLLWLIVQFLIVGVVSSSSGLLHHRVTCCG
jgi:hypothetical protein